MDDACCALAFPCIPTHGNFYSPHETPTYKHMHTKYTVEKPYYKKADRLIESVLGWENPLSLHSLKHIYSFTRHSHFHVTDSFVSGTAEAGGGVPQNHLDII